MENHWNLQLFADEPGTENGTEQQGAGISTTTQSAAGAAPLTFDDVLMKGGYQAEFDRRVSKAIDTAKSKFVDPRVAQLQAQLEGYQRRDAVVAAGVNADFAEFVAYKVTGSMAEGDAFADKLKAFVEANPQYVGSSTRPAAWGAHQTGGSGQTPTGVETEFKKLNPNLKL